MTFWKNGFSFKNISWDEVKTKILENLLGLFLAAWPVILGVLVMFEPQLPESSLRFVHNFGQPDFFKYSPDYFTIATWIIIGIWSYLYLKADRKRTNDLNESFTTAPNYKVLGEPTRIYIDGSAQILKSLDPYDSLFLNNDFTRLDELTTSISTVAFLTKEHAVNFFDIGNSNTIGVTCMIYFEVSTANEKAIETLLSKTKIYYRSDRSSELEGVLFLPSILNSPIANNKTKAYELVIPIYKMQAGVYTATNCTETNIMLPGAPSAFYLGNSYIGNTTVLRNYANIDNLSQKEIIDYFKNQGKGIKSLASFAISSSTDNGEVIGVLNIESSLTSFQRKAEAFNTFHSLVYPTLKDLCKYLEFYKRHLLIELSKP